MTTSVQSTSPRPHGSRLAAYTILALAALVGGVSLLAFFVLFLFVGPLDLIRLELSETTKSAWNTLLCVVFFLQHSVMVRRSYCRWSARFIPPHLHGASYTIASGVALLALVVLWQESAHTLMSAGGTAWWLLRSAYFLSIVGFGWGILALGSFDTFGLKPILDRLRGTDTTPTVHGSWSVPLGSPPPLLVFPIDDLVVSESDDGPAAIQHTVDGLDCGWHATGGTRSGGRLWPNISRLQARSAYADSVSPASGPAESGTPVRLIVTPDLNSPEWARHSWPWIHSATSSIRAPST
jgi:hypothetical protein